MNLAEFSLIFLKYPTIWMAENLNCSDLMKGEKNGVD